MPRSPHGIKAWVELDGEKAEEYALKRKVRKGRKGRKKEIECFIACKTEQKVQIVCSVPPHLVKKGMLMVEVDTDGYIIYVPNNDIEKDASASEMTTLRFEEAFCCECVRPLPSPAARAAQEQNEPLKTNIAALEAGWCSVKCETTSRPLQFEALDVTDDDAYIGKETKYFGEIGVTLYSISRFSEVVTHSEEGSDTASSIGWFNPDTVTIVKKMPDADGPFPEELCVHETAKDHRTHALVFGKERHNTKRVINLKPEEANPICTFVFHYRHMDMLKATGIVPNDTGKTIGNSTMSTSPRPRKRQPKSAAGRNDSRSSAPPRTMNLRSHTCNKPEGSSSGQMRGPRIKEESTRGSAGANEDDSESEQAHMDELDQRTLGHHDLDVKEEEPDDCELEDELDEDTSDEEEADGPCEGITRSQASEEEEGMEPVKDEEDELEIEMSASQGVENGQEFDELTSNTEQPKESQTFAGKTKIQQLEEKIERRKRKVVRDQERLAGLIMKKRLTEDGTQADYDRLSRGSERVVEAAGSHYHVSKPGRSLKRGAEFKGTPRASKRVKIEPETSLGPRDFIDLTLD